jgi:predicted RNase H-like nuclease (RuvC/YqgF family)
LDEYRELVSSPGTTPPANNETVSKLTQEKEQLTKEVAELRQFINTLKAQLELAESKVVESFYVPKSVNTFFKNLLLECGHRY